MSSSIKIFKEPLVEFRYGQKLEDPHDGLSLFGPYDTDLPSHPKNITYGVLGPDDGIMRFARWSNQVSRPIVPEEGLDKRIWQPFPGFEAAFEAVWPAKPSWSYSLDRNELVRASQHRDPYKRAYDVVKMYLEGISIVRKRDEAFDVLICIVPEEVWRNCRPLSRPADPWGYFPPRKIRKQRSEGLVSIDDWFSGKLEPRDWSPEQYKLSVDFRRQLKAKSMKYGIPIQIIRESTLEPDKEEYGRILSPISDIAWNLSTTLYYKSGGKPWKLADAREGVCYIGIAFRRSGDKEDDTTACCAAQMFLDSGDGIVFLGDEGPWYSPRDRQFHLGKKAARRLLEGILKTYEDLEGQELKEIFLHSRSSIDELEFLGYEKACPVGVKLVGVNVRLERGGVKLFREGRKPVMRSTFWKWNERKGNLWASGFKPRLGTYDGWDIPVPLKIELQHGKAEIEQIAYDILCLTKLNYNACKLGDSEPVTIMFSDAVGEILVSNPIVKERSPNFKFYI
jgi:hypothetical protein